MIKVLFPLFSLILTAACSLSVPADGLVFDASSGKAGSIELPTGETVNYTAYEKLYFVTNVEDPTYQYMNVYVPDGATQKTPIFLRTYVGGYMASEAAAPQAGDATGRALVPVPVAFATKLENAGLDVDFLLAWNRPHSGDYALDEVFNWIRQITGR